jgi:5-methylcytosine-specific restriction endonuclease McrA
MPIVRLCAAAGCRAVVTSRGRCPEHRRQAEAQKLAKRQLHKRNTASWRRLATVVKARDGRCVDCGTDNGLTVHLDPALQGRHDLATTDDCVTLCRRCHGIRDGGRAH